MDDARFETLVVKQTKQSVLEEARQRANGKYYPLFSIFFNVFDVVLLSVAFSINVSFDVVINVVLYASHTAYNGILQTIVSRNSCLM